MHKAIANVMSFKILTRRDAIKGAGVAMVAAASGVAVSGSSLAATAIDPHVAWWAERNLRFTEHNRLCDLEYKIEKKKPEWYLAEPRTEEQATRSYNAPFGCGLNLSLANRKGWDFARKDMMKNFESWKQEQLIKFKALEARREYWRIDSGLTAAIEKGEKEYERISELEKLIKSTPAKTPEGLEVLFSLADEWLGTIWNDDRSEIILQTIRSLVRPIAAA